MTKTTAKKGVATSTVAEYEAKGLQVREIALLLGISRQAVHYHLKKLREAEQLSEDVEGAA